jgi:tetratricopeptide (TPR) repeat protein
MKAEHRKELRTNVLAASVNRLAERLKHPPKRRTLLWVVLLLLVLTLVGVWWWYQRNRARGLSERWLLSYYLEPQTYQRLLNYPRSRPTQAAHLQENWQMLWEVTRRLPLLSSEAAATLEKLQRDYEQLAEECRDFPDWSAEAAYQAAVAQEILSFQDRKNLQEALRRYQKVIDDYPKTAWAEEAKTRVRLLNDSSSRQQMEQFYESLGRSVRLLSPPAGPPPASPAP